jgi:FKBP12-rapamycin complex-associated protein
MAGGAGGEDAVAETQTSMLLSVLCGSVVQYFDDTNRDIRRAAVDTAVSVLDKVVSPDLGAQAQQAVADVVQRLLALGIGDDDADIRFYVLRSFGESPTLDQLIAQSNFVHFLIEALSDEQGRIQAAAMSCLARVAHYDTAHVMPLVRQNLSALMRQLQNSRDQVLRRESMQLLQAMVRGSGTLIVPYVPQVLDLLLRLLDDPSAGIRGAALSTTGELAMAAPQLVHHALNRIISLIVESLSEASTETTTGASVFKQEVAVVALGKLVTSLNITSGLYATYPSLFESLVTVIRDKDESPSLRLQAVRTAGASSNPTQL